MEESEIQKKQVKILWTFDDLNGPTSGLALYNDEKVWFSEIKDPNMVPSTTVKVPLKDELSKKLTPQAKHFVLKKLDDEIVSEIEKHHKDFCENTGFPLNHGDAFVPKRQTMVIVDKKQKQTTTKTRGLSEIRTYVHGFKPADIKGQAVAVVKIQDFENYYVPKRINV